MGEGVLGSFIGDLLTSSFRPVADDLLAESPPFLPVMLSGFSTALVKRNNVGSIPNSGT